MLWESLHKARSGGSGDVIGGCLFLSVSQPCLLCDGFLPGLAATTCRARGSRLLRVGAAWRTVVFRCSRAKRLKISTLVCYRSVHWGPEHSPGSLTIISPPLSTQTFPTLAPLIGPAHGLPRWFHETRVSLCLCPALSPFLILSSLSPRPWTPHPFRIKRRNKTPAGPAEVHAHPQPWRITVPSGMCTLMDLGHTPPVGARA